MRCSLLITAQLVDDKELLSNRHARCSLYPVWLRVVLAWRQSAFAPKGIWKKPLSFGLLSAYRAPADPNDVPSTQPPTRAVSAIQTANQDTYS